MPIEVIPVTPERTGRWICHLCPWPTWQTGTYQDSQDHYQTEHQHKG